MHSYNVIQISETQIIRYRETVGSFTRSILQRENEKNLRDVSYLGYMSRKTRSKVQKMLATWVNSVRFGNSDFRNKEREGKPYITFVTLTLTEEQKHNDNEAKRLYLNRFIIALKQKQVINNYFWRAEAQKNGNIHFHLLIDAFFGKDDLRSIWNDILRDYGYNCDSTAEINNFESGSTMIHKLEKINNVEAYVCKYCCKIDGYRKIEGRVWGCSDALRDLKPCTLFLEDYVEQKLDKMVENKEIEAFEGDSFKIYKINALTFLKKNFYKQFTMYRKHLLNCYDSLYYPNIKIQKIEEIQKFVPMSELKKSNYSKLQQLNLF
jgi:hypothetical protein